MKKIISLVFVAMMVVTMAVAVSADAEKEIDAVTRKFRRGLISDAERSNLIIKIWNKATEDVADLHANGGQQEGDHADHPRCSPGAKRQSHAGNGRHLQGYTHGKRVDRGGDCLRKQFGHRQLFFLLFSK